MQVGVLSGAVKPSVTWAGVFADPLDVSEDPWGNLTSGATTSGHAYTGREWDPETSLYYYRARYYDPKVGRFLSQDPVGLRGGVNFYTYVGNQPTYYRDPWGLLITVSDSYTPARKAEVQGLLDAISQTQRGHDLIKPIMDDPNRNLVIKPDARDEPRYSPERDTIYFDPRGQYPLNTENGREIAAPIIVLAHELGHAVDFPDRRRMYDEYRNVNVNENPIRRELCFPLRVSYP